LYETRSWEAIHSSTKPTVFVVEIEEEIRKRVTDPDC